MITTPADRCRYILNHHFFTYSAHPPAFCCTGRVWVAGGFSCGKSNLGIPDRMVSVLQSILAERTGLARGWREQALFLAYMIQRDPSPNLNF